MPTVNVSRGLGNAHPLPYALDAKIDKLTFTPLNSDKAISFKESLGLNYTDGLIILHRGKVVYERYLGELSEDKQHAAMSVTKSITGLLASVLVAEGKLDPNKKVAHYLPELKDSGFGDAKVEHVMNMTTALQFSEDYANPDAEIWSYSAAANPPTNTLADMKGPVGYYQALAQIEKMARMAKLLATKPPMPMRLAG